MKKIIGYLRAYIKNINKRVLVLSMLFVSIGIFINYYWGLNRRISTYSPVHAYISWLLVFLSALSLPYMMLWVLARRNYFKNKTFLLLLLAGPALFAWKMSFDMEIHFSNDVISNGYWNQVLYWPYKLSVFIIVLLAIWKLTGYPDSFYGWTTKEFKPKPYLIMLMIMVPLIAAASTQSDFLAMYPKMLHHLFFQRPHVQGIYKLLYELSYGSDFISIELFFRGFLVLAFVRWAGKDAILPMACFYCTIHFGKPLGECISSFFGGMILGIVTYHTRTIFGGLMVHLGIAWLMEIGGYIGNLYIH